MLKLWLTLPILLAACLKDETASGRADPRAVYALREWNAQAFSGTATISFPEPGRIAGDAPCNRFFANLTVPYPWFAIDRIGTTRRACPEAQTENEFFKALRSASLVEVSGPVLILSNDEGLQMVFRAGQD